MSAIGYCLLHGVYECDACARQDRALVRSIVAPAADTRPADLAYLRTDARLAVERACYGAGEWEAAPPRLAIRDKILRRADGEVCADTRPDRPGEVRFHFADPTSDIGAAMALVDGLQVEGWPGTAYVEFAHAIHTIAKKHPNHVDFSPFAWLECQCPPHLKSIVRTIAVLAARGAEWRKYLPLLAE